MLTEILERREAFALLLEGKTDIWVGDMQRKIGSDEFISFTPIKNCTVKDLLPKDGRELVFIRHRKGVEPKKKSQSWEEMLPDELEI